MIMIIMKHSMLSATVCAVCAADFGAVDTCGHPVCEDCMRKWAQKRLDLRKAPNCPYCRQEAVGWRAQLVHTLAGTHFRIAVRSNTVAGLRRAMRCTLCIPERCMRFMETRPDGTLVPLDGLIVDSDARITVVFRVMLPALVTAMAPRPQVAVHIMQPSADAPTLLVVYPRDETVASLARRAGRPHQRKIIREADGALIRTSLAPLRDGDTLYFPHEA